MYHTPETLLNHVFEDLRKTKAPNSRDPTNALYHNNLETQIPFGIEGDGEEISSFPQQSPAIPKGI
jgi:hypothetical protein